MDLSSHPAVNKEFLENILKKCVTSLKVTGGSRPGDNFTSILFSIEALLKDTEKPLYLLMKTYPSHPARQKFLEDTNLFLKELMVYKLLIPEYMKFQKEVGNKIILELALPPFVDGKAVDYDIGKENGITNGVHPQIERPLGTHEVDNYLLMVDIRKTSGFKMADKCIGLDFDHCKLVLTELAKLHALSLGYKNHKRIQLLTDKFPFLVETLFAGQSSVFLEPMIKANFKIMSELVERESMNGNREGLLKSIKHLEMNFMDVFLLFLNPKGVDEKEASKLMRVQPECNGLRPEDQWVSGNHGDSWINNMLFTYDEQTKKPLKTTMVDLQLARESCITIDLVYFFYSSTDHKLRKEHLNELLEVYYNSFVKFCEILNTEPFPGFTLNNLKARFHRSKVLGFLFGVLLLPVILQSPESSVDLDNVPVNEDGSASATDLSELIQTNKKTESDEKLMEARFLGLVNEMVEQGIL